MKRFPSFVIVLLMAVFLTALMITNWKRQSLSGMQASVGGKIALLPKLAAGDPVKYLPKPHEPLDDLPEAERNRLYEQKAERMRRTLEAEDKPIAFYGRIMDQHKNPVPGAQVAAYVIYNGSTLSPGLMPKRKEVNTETDPAGRFAITGQRGYSIDLYEITKEGYAFEWVRNLSYTTDNFLSGAAGSSADRPYGLSAYHIESPPEQLIDGRDTYGIVPDGRVYTIDLIKREKTEGSVVGDLQVAIKRPVDSTPNMHSPWSAVVRVPDGGLIETDEKLMIEAPAEGYKSEWTTAYSSQDASQQGGETKASWDGTKNRTFFIKSRGGQVYGKVEIRVSPYFGIENIAAVRISQSINAHGSRNLYSGKAQ